jgi:hypothetical protein
VKLIALLATACAGLTTEGATEWREVETVGPPARWGHVMALDAARDRVLVFGGIGDRGFYGDLWALELETMSWTEIADTGDVPSGRITATAIVDAPRDRMILVGGAPGIEQADDGVFALDLATHEWTRITSIPDARYDHNAVVTGDRLLVYAGYGTGRRVFDDLWELDLTRDEWRELPDDGVRPASRSNGAIAYADGSLYVTGGHDDIRTLGDTWRYDLERARWEPIDRVGDPTVGAHYAYDRDPRCGVLYVFGGDDNDYYDVAATERLTLETRARFTRVPAGALPPPRRHAAMIADPIRTRLVLFGGSAGFETSFEDTWTFDLPPCP